MFLFAVIEPPALLVMTASVVSLMFTACPSFDSIVPELINVKFVFLSAITVPSKAPSCFIMPPILLITVTPDKLSADCTEPLSSPLLIVALLVRVTLSPPSPIVCWFAVSYTHLTLPTKA